MVRPTRFGFNPETAASNAFQQNAIADDVVSEFDHLVKALDCAGIEPLVFDQAPDCPSPDAVFPNNWVSFHEDGAVLYPILSPLRRTERNLDILQALGKQVLCDLSHFEQDNRYLEGTGSLVLDRKERFCFACVSDRTDRMLAFQWCQRMDYRLIDFDTIGPGNVPVYHTNVVGTIGEGVVVVCQDVIQDQSLLEVFTSLDDYEVVVISPLQMTGFCGNILQLQGTKGKVIAMSELARQTFTNDQIRVLEKHGTIVAVPIPSIERVGGGSVRCMLAEVF
ncbi:MAG: hypothetical protein JNK63_11490 [Chthonomonas sp.]|nr:hypothetical protein [Chthonomonas sp.]